MTVNQATSSLKNQKKAANTAQMPPFKRWVFLPEIADNWSDSVVLRIKALVKQYNPFLTFLSEANVQIEKMEVVLKNIKFSNFIIHEPLRYKGRLCIGCIKLRILNGKFQESMTIWLSRNKRPLLLSYFY